MKFNLYRASESGHDSKEIELVTLDDLKRLDEETGKHGLVVSFDGYKGKNTITIYDDYLE